MKPGESVISPSEVDVSPGLLRGDGRAARARPVLRRARRRLSAIAKVSRSIDETLAKRFWPDRIRSAAACTSRGRAGDLTAITDEDRVLHRRRRDRRHQAARPDRGRAGGGRLLLSDGAGHLRGHDVRGQDRRRSDVADERAARDALPRSTASCRCSTCRRWTRMEKSLVSRRSPALLSLSFGVGGAVPVGDRHLWRARVPRDAAHEGDRHPHRARQQRAAIFELVLREGLVLVASVSCSARSARSSCARGSRASCSASARPIRSSLLVVTECSAWSRSSRARCRRAGRRGSIRSSR